MQVNLRKDSFRSLFNSYSYIHYSDNNRMEGSHTNIYELHVYEKEFSIYSIHFEQNNQAGRNWNYQ